MRKSEIKRVTAETDISLFLDLDGTGKAEIDSGIGFLDHMLTLFAAHGGFDLSLKCKGDTRVDDHHSAEDIGICLGKALKEALGSKAGILRYGSLMLPMDEALIAAAVDISGRGMLCFSTEINAEKIGMFDVELIEEFFIAFARNAEVTLHIQQLAGKNAHHIAEGIFKGTARALRTAVKVEGTSIPSTKGVI